MLVIGLDAASQWENFGFAIGRIGNGTVAIEQAGLIADRSRPEVLASIIGPLLRTTDQALVAIDAPLGWPAPLGTSLAFHKAGEKLPSEKHESFCRETDRWVRKQIGKKPLDVGADKIALAAYTALEALSILRQLSGKPIPLAWNPRFSGIAAIEVYPGATLKAAGLPDTGYTDTNKDQSERNGVRRDIAAGLQLRLTGLAPFISAQDDVFDACLCLAAALDFLEGRAMPPTDHANAEREGWIWVRSPMDPAEPRGRGRS